MLTTFEISKNRVRDIHCYPTLAAIKRLLFDELPPIAGFGSRRGARPMKERNDEVSNNIKISSDKIFLEIYYQNVRKLLDFATRYLNNTVDIEDAVSNVFARLWSEEG